MKIKEGFMLRTVANQTVVLPVSGDLDLNMMIKLNDTGRFLWEHLQKDTTEEELVAAVLSTYDVAAEDAAKYVRQFVQELEKNGFVS